MGILLYPIAVVLFWYKDGAFALLLYFRSLNDYCIRLFSLPGLFVTFFRPLKNEYRKNLVVFSILFGMIVKTFLVIASLGVLAALFALEVLIFVSYILFPILPILVLFYV